MSCYRWWMNNFSKMKVHLWTCNHCLFVSYLTSVAFGWILDTKFQKFSDKDWMWIFKKFIGYGSGVKKSISAHLCSRDEQTVVLCDPDPVLNFQNSVQVQPQPKLFLKLKVQIKSKKLPKYSFLITNITQFFSINSVQIRSDPKFTKQFTVRVQSRF